MSEYISADKKTRLARIQDVEYKALCSLVEYCRENKLRLFLRGGSVLGAVKYGDFVPWDDDIDVALPRQDYEKLIRSYPRCMNDNLFVAYQDDVESHCYFPRIVLSTNRCIDLDLPCNNERGLVLIDILPLDGMPSGKVKLLLHSARVNFYRFLASLHTMHTINNPNDRMSIKKVLQRLAYSTKLHSLYKQNDIYKRMDATYKQYSYEDSEFVGMLSSSKRSKEIMPRTNWEDGIEFSFRDAKVLVPTAYDAYLSKLFGSDWATSEPSESARLHAAHIVGLER